MEQGRSCCEAELDTADFIVLSPRIVIWPIEQYQYLKVSMAPFFLVDHFELNAQVPAAGAHH